MERDFHKNMRAVFFNPETGRETYFQPLNRRVKTMAEVMAIHFAQIGLPLDTSYDVVHFDDFPHNDNDYRNAWRLDPKSRKVVVNLEIAKELHKDKMREARRPLLDALDWQQNRAMGNRDDAAVSELNAKKQALRDVTDIDLSQVATVEELRTVWPEILGEKP